jgi:hypothetical protein
MASDSGSPCLWWFLAQLDRARSISGNLPFDLFMGDRLPSSWYRYFSFWRNTFETVLLKSQHEKGHDAYAVVPSLYPEHG